jgi:hypothetical protein
MRNQNWDQPDNAGKPVFPCTGWGTAHFHTAGVLQIEFLTSADGQGPQTTAAQPLHFAFGASKLRQLASDLLSLADVLDSNQATPRH